MNLSSASISSSLAAFRSQALTSLVNRDASSESNVLWSGNLSHGGSGKTPTDPLSMSGKNGGANGLSATGRKLSLYDPESAYKMMGVINNNDTSYKAQFSELSQMKSAISQVRDAGQSLSSIGLSSSNDDIAAELKNFVGKYNSWIERFNPDMQSGGVLADTQAAQVSRYELEQSIKNIFNGAKDGVHGLADLGLTIDPGSKLASLDTAKLDSLLSSNRLGAVDALQEFSGNFTKSATLLNSDGNFIPNRLNNLHQVIDYYAENKSSLQNEFGTGAVAQPTGQVARALAAYNLRFAA